MFKLQTPLIRDCVNFAFEAHKGRMNYAASRERNLPIGSGVIESTIRRVVNLRLKGASVGWLESTAQDMLLLRSFYKANRWQNIVKQGVMIGNSLA